MRAMSNNTNNHPGKPTYKITRSSIWNEETGLQQNNYIAQVEEIIKNKNESLTYARILQDAIIPGKENLGRIFPESFVFHSPKEIISGDFCWIEQMGDITFVAAGDSTGHGVPGALMSIVCSNALTRAVKDFGITKPGEILDRVRDLVIHAFSNSMTDIKDGMDISLCAINRKTYIVEWSGANNPLLYHTNGSLYELLANKQPVGRHEKYEPFTTHTLQLNKGDMLYLFTDGFADQFGGQRSKKLMYRCFKQIITELTPYNMEIQKGSLLRIFDEWKGSLEQVDDVLLLGIKL